MTDTLDDALWWRDAVVYQIYPRSFADSDGDGLGDLGGIISRSDYLASLSIDAVWLSPFYPSALADGGYDVDDYRDVDPRLGTLSDMDEVIATLHARGIRVIVDIVPNHTSNRHEWFRQALEQGRGSAARDRYIFREGSGSDGSEPPTDWVSNFGGPAWTKVADGQWYLHHFAAEQPDLNWSNREVRDDFLTTLRFWADRGVDGFRIDVAHMLTKDLTEPLPSQAALDALPREGAHPTIDRDDVHEVYAEWRRVFNEYDPPRSAVAEAWVDTHRIPRYASREGLGQAFNFDLLEADFSADQFRRIVTKNLELAKTSGSSSTWVLSNHDVVRHPTRYGLPNPPRSADGRPLSRHGEEWLRTSGESPQLDREGGERRARAATLFVLGLPGSTYLYQGEELGLHEVAELDDADRQDPTFFRTDGAEMGRDGCRVPLPWAAEGESFGFSAVRAHLPQPGWFGDYAVEVQEGNPSSTLELYGRALRLRREHQALESLEWIQTGRDDVLHYMRPNGWHVVTNFGAEPYWFERDDPMLSSSDLHADGIPAETTLWFGPARKD